MVTALWSARSWREPASGNRTFANLNHMDEMWIVCVYYDALKLSWPPSRRLVTTGSELAPVEAEVHDQQRGKCEGNHADSG